MKKRAFRQRTRAVLAALIATSGAGSSQDGCEELLKQGIWSFDYRNATEEQFEIYSRFLASEHESHSEWSGAFLAGPVNLSGEGESDRYDSRLEIAKSAKGGTFTETELTKLADKNLLQAYLDCKGLASMGIRVMLKPDSHPLSGIVRVEVANQPSFSKAESLTLELEGVKSPTAPIVIPPGKIWSDVFERAGERWYSRPPVIARLRGSGDQRVWTLPGFNLQVQFSVVPTYFRADRFKAIAFLPTVQIDGKPQFAEQGVHLSKASWESNGWRTDPRSWATPIAWSSGRMAYSQIVGKTCLLKLATKGLEHSRAPHIVNGSLQGTVLEFVGPETRPSTVFLGAEAPKGVEVHPFQIAQHGWNEHPGEMLTMQVSARIVADFRDD